MILAIAVPKLPPPKTATVKRDLIEKKPKKNKKFLKITLVFCKKNLSENDNFFKKWHMNLNLKLSTFSVDNLVDSFLEAIANPYKI